MNQLSNKISFKAVHKNIMTPEEVYALACIVRNFYGRYFAFPNNELVVFNFNNVEDEIVKLTKDEVEKEGNISFGTFIDVVYNLIGKKVFLKDNANPLYGGKVSTWIDSAQGNLDCTWIKVRMSGQIIPYLVKKAVETPVNIKENVEWK